MRHPGGARDAPRPPPSPISLLLECLPETPPPAASRGPPVSGGCFRRPPLPRGSPARRWGPVLSVLAPAAHQGRSRAPLPALDRLRRLPSLAARRDERCPPLFAQRSGHRGGDETWPGLRELGVQPAVRPALPSAPCPPSAPQTPARPGLLPSRGRRPRPVGRAPLGQLPASSQFAWTMLLKHNMQSKGLVCALECVVTRKKRKRKTTTTGSKESPAPQSPCQDLRDARGGRGVCCAA